ncbi:hypothetical protein OH77DRAFT_1588744 [Trametes cingulata]|nr:hypothetical protein OH77DRAFT_1588744 [Trametes cingulata]
MASFKRPRSTANQDDSSSPSPTSSPTLKAARTSATPPPPGAGEPSTSSSHILCTLPPTCNPPNRPTHLAGTRELEAHYAMYHAHVCEEMGCGCVFPDARLLELHQTECHDPLAAVRRERGEKIFACHLASCPRRFSTPKTRRLHLIQAHGYPKEYFFAVTNKGVGGLLKRWGEGASLLRRPWQRREDGSTAEPDENDDGPDMDGHQREEVNGSDDISDDEDQILLEKMSVDRPAAANGSSSHPQQSAPPCSKGKVRAEEPSEEVDSLANAMDSLSLVPASIQFGRGAKRGALHGARGRVAPGHVRRGSRGRGGSAAPMELDDSALYGHVRGRGRGAGRIAHAARGGTIRGLLRGRGGGPHAHGFPGPRGTTLGGGVGRGLVSGRGVSKGGSRL